MADVPDDDLRKIRDYAEQVISPDFQDQIRMKVDIRGNTVTIVECRPPWPEDSGPDWTRQGVARMKFAPENGKWTLYWSDSNSRWHIFDLITPGPIDKILKEVERDKTNIFWGLIDRAGPGILEARPSIEPCGEHRVRRKWRLTSRNVSPLETKP